YGVAWRTARKARTAGRRRRRREGAPAETAPEPHAPCAGPWSDLRRVIDEELVRLPECYRSALVLCDLEGLPRAEAASRLERAEGRIARARARGADLLRRPLRRRGLALSAAAHATLLAANARASVAGSLLTATTRAALGGTVSISAAALARAVSRDLALPHRL